MSAMSLADLVRTEKGRKVLAFYAAGIAAVLGGAWTAFTFFVHPEPSKPAQAPSVSASVVQSPTITVSPTFNVPPPALPPIIALPPEIRITDARKTEMWSSAAQPDDAFTMPVAVIVEKKGTDVVKNCSAELWVKRWRKTISNSSFVDSDTKFNFQEGTRRKEIELYFDISLGAARSEGLQVRMICDGAVFADWEDLR